MKSLKYYSPLFIVFIFSLFLASCNKENATEPKELTDEEFIQQVVTGGYSNNSYDEDNLLSQELTDLDNGGAIKDDDNNPSSPFDSLMRWGRKIISRDRAIENTGNDTIRNVSVTSTISGNYIIIGYRNGQIDSITKPYTEKFYRNVIFKRVARTQYPRLNWRVYQMSNTDGGTTLPQVGSSQVQITKVEIYRYGSVTPAFTFNGPDFQYGYYTTMLFGGAGIPSFNRGKQVVVKVYTFSQQATTDYVAFHWAKNSFGFHRIPFTLENQNGQTRIYSKTFDIYAQHRIGVFNGYISASTHESLYDNNANKFASDEVGIPYKVIQ